LRAIWPSKCWTVFRDRKTQAILLADSADNTAAVEEVRNTLDSLRKKDGDRASYHLAQGVLEARQGNDTAAEQKFNEALKLEPKSTGALSAMATLHWKAEGPQ